MATAFTLNITFAGLCLIATDDTQPAGSLLHVLMMKYDQQNQTGMQHFARLVYDEDYATGKSTGNRVLSCLKLDNGVLDITSGTTPIDIVDLPKDVADLDDIAKVGKLDPSYVTRNSNHVANARVTLHNGRYASEGKASEFYIGPTHLPLNHYTVWTMSAVTNDQNSSGTDCLTLAFGALESNGSAPSSIQLCPIGDVINLYFLNAMATDIPTAGVQTVPPAQYPKDMPALHFEAYYSAFPGTPDSVVAQSVPLLLDVTPDPDDSPLKGWTGGCTWGSSAPGAMAEHLVEFRPPVKTVVDTITQPVCIHAIVKVGITPPASPTALPAAMEEHSNQMAHAM